MICATVWLPCGPAHPIPEPSPPGLLPPCRLPDVTRRATLAHLWLIRLVSQAHRCVEEARSDEQQAATLNRLTSSVAPPLVHPHSWDVLDEDADRLSDGG